jgi:hypothetical protein
MTDNVIELPKPEEGKEVRRRGRQPQRTAGVWRMDDGSFEVRCKVEHCEWRYPGRIELEETAFEIVSVAMHEVVKHPELVREK